MTLDQFFEFFSSMQTDNTNIHEQESEDFCRNYDFDRNKCNFEELDIPVCLSEVECAIKKLKRGKSYAGDQLINEYFIETADILAPHIVDLFNLILDTGHFPSEWSEGIIVPVHKKNDIDDVNNYRGITLVSCFSKLFTSILNKRLNTWAENYNICGDTQFGFRKGKSTVDAIFVLNAVIQKFLSRNDRLYCAFIDLRKAFDSVYLNGLWYKIYQLGINGKMLNIVRSMYNNVKCCVRRCSSYSDFFNV